MIVRKIGKQKNLLDAQELGLKEGLYMVQAESKGAIIGTQKLAVKF